MSLLSAAARRLEGKVALITGGARGIGECTARLFSKHGAKVVIVDILDNLGHSVCNDINSHGPETASFIHCDVTKENDVADAVDATISMHGKLDIMYNNAGISGPIKTNILDVDMSEFEQVVKVNLIGPFLGIKHAARVMVPTRQGSIITTASVAGSIGGCAPHAYTSAKHGVVGLTRNAAVELGQFGIRVNCVSPFGVGTEMVRKAFGMVDIATLDLSSYSNLKGVGLGPEDVAEAALYLGSDDSKYVSGHNLMVDGGFTIFNASSRMFYKHRN